MYGVDFSGAKLAGRTTWVSRLEPARGTWRLIDLGSLEAHSTHLERDGALAWLAEAIASSDDALWAMDFPFALPIEVVKRRSGWRDQLDAVRRWRRGAYALGVRCCEVAHKKAGRLHIRRLTDVNERTPLDCYHYRIIYQTFHGMRDVLLPLSQSNRTAVLPFDYRRLRRARNVVIESCPGSVLRRLKWPHFNYKQPTGGPLTRVRRRTRREILDRLCGVVEIGERDRRRIMRDPGGDALDAVLAAAGAVMRWDAVDHRAIARHARYPLEGFVYA